MTISPTTAPQPETPPTGTTLVRRGGLDRRFLVGGAVGAGIAAAGLTRIGQAQDSGDDATPDAATPTDSTDDEPTEDWLAAEGTRVDALIASVTADRDAVAAGIDPAPVDALLGQATALREATATGGSDTALRSLMAAGLAARSARGLLIAQLTYAGLPSQEVSASRVLARSHEAIASALDSASGEGSAVAFLDTAQALYATAYDQYGSGAYAQAAANGSTGLQLAAAAAILGGEGEPVVSGGFGIGRPGRTGHLEIEPGFVPGSRVPEGDDLPADVPAPDFGS